MDFSHKVLPYRQWVSRAIQITKCFWCIIANPYSSCIIWCKAAEPGNDPDIIPPDDDTEDIPGGNEDDPEDVGNDEPVTGIDEGQDPESLDDPE